MMHECPSVFLALGCRQTANTSHSRGQIRENVLPQLPLPPSSNGRQIPLFEAPELVYEISSWNCFKRTSFRLPLARVPAEI